MIYYFYLTAAIMLELAATTLLKYSEGFTKLLPTVCCCILYGFCFFSLSKALNGLNLGVAYATWCGVGIVASALISAFIFRQGLTILGILGVVLIVTGCLVLNLSGAAQ